jgi:hypothetical protein
LATSPPAEPAASTVRVRSQQELAEANRSGGRQAGGAMAGGAAGQPGNIPPGGGFGAAPSTADAPQIVLGISAAPALQAAQAAEAKTRSESGGRDKPAAPAALYFNPQLVTDAQGRATIDFTMPAVESEYLLLIDALGHGRIGSRQQQLIIGGSDAK